MRTRAQEAAAGPRWHGSGRRLFAGAKGNWGWGAPFTTRITPRRRARARQLNGADDGAAATAQGAAGRSTAGAQLRRPRYDDVEHKDDNKRHLRVPYLAVNLQRPSRRRKRRQTSGARVWRRRGASSRLGFWAKGAGAARGGDLYRPRGRRLGMWARDAHQRQRPAAHAAGPHWAASEAGRWARGATANQAAELRGFRRT
jgi:hypothetical protein